MNKLFKDNKLIYSLLVQATKLLYRPISIRPINCLQMIWRIPLKLTIIATIILFSSIGFSKDDHHLLGVERGLFDGFSFHIAPWKLDLGLSYGLSYATGSSYISDPSYTESYELTQTAFRLGIYSQKYGTDSFYANLVFGQIDMKTSRNSNSLGKRSGTSRGTFTVPGFGYHWFWENFNLRLGAANGRATYPKTEFKNSAGTLIETGYPTSLYYDTVFGIDLGIGWAFF